MIESHLFRISIANPASARQIFLQIRAKNRFFEDSIRVILKYFYIELNTLTLINVSLNEQTHANNFTLATMTTTKYQKQKTLKEEFLKIDFKTKHVKAQVWVYAFMSEEHHVAYIPSLNLTAYGPTEKDAIEMLFEDCMKDLFDNLWSLPEYAIIAELGKYGWKRSKIHKKQFKSMSYIDADGVLNNFNMPKETKISRQFVAA